MTYILSFIVAFGVAVIAGQILIPLLRRLKAGQAIREDGPTWHMAKQGTPTMGGLMFIIGIGLTILVLGWRRMLGGSFVLILYLYSMGLSYHQLMSSSYLALEVIRAIASSIGVVLSVPITAAVASVLYGKK